LPTEWLDEPSETAQEDEAEATLAASLREVFSRVEIKAEPGAPEFLDFGWLVHNANPNSLGTLTLALSNLGGDLDPIGAASNMTTEHGKVGDVRSALMLAESLIRTAQLQKPVLMAETAPGGEMILGLVRPREACLHEGAGRSSG
jgi:hypothetical protein